MNLISKTRNVLYVFSLVFCLTTVAMEKGEKSEHALIINVDGTVNIKEVRNYVLANSTLEFCTCVLDLEKREDARLESQKNGMLISQQTLLNQSPDCKLLFIDKAIELISQENMNLRSRYMQIHHNRHIVNK